MSKTIQFITRTAILLALTLVFQSLRVIIPIPKPVDQFIVGSLVNLCLMVAAVVVGIKGGLIIAVLAPVVAFLQGFLPPFVVMIPIIALGNAVIVFVFASYYEKNRIVAWIAGSILKFLALYILVVKLALPFFIAPQLQEPKLSAISGTLSLNFSWPQLVTALIGGAVALVVLPLLQKALKMESTFKA